MSSRARVYAPPAAPKGPKTPTKSFIEARGVPDSAVLALARGRSLEPVRGDEARGGRYGGLHPAKTVLGLGAHPARGQSQQPSTLHHSRTLPPGHTSSSRMPLQQQSSQSTSPTDYTHHASATVRNKVLVAKVIEIFKQFDVDGNGSVDKLELRKVLQILDPDTWTDERSDHLFKVIDTSRDDRIQFEELLRWVFSSRGGECETPGAFRETVKLGSEVASTLAVVVKTVAGDTIFGPEEILGEMTASNLRRSVYRGCGLTAGCFCLADGSIIRDTMVLGALLGGDDEPNKCPRLELTLISNILTMLTPACTRELQQLGALGEFENQPCIRLGTGDRAHRIEDGAAASSGCDSEGAGAASSSGFGTGDDDCEFMLTADGRVLAKLYHYWGHVERNRICSRDWRYEIAEGSFSVLDPGVCVVELNWRKWSVRSGHDPSNSAEPPKADILKPWEAKLVDEIDMPRHLVPSKGSQANILNVARQWLKGYVAGDRQNKIDPKKNPLAGLPMPGITERVLNDLEMDRTNVEYWIHGDKTPGPFT